MKSKNKISTRDIFLIAFMLVVLGVGALVIFVYLPQTDELGRLNDELYNAHEMQAEMERQGARLTYLQGVVAGFDAFIDRNLGRFEVRGNNEDLDHDFTSFLVHRGVDVLEVRIIDGGSLFELETATASIYVGESLLGGATGYIARQEVFISIRGDWPDQILFLDYINEYFWSFRVISYNFVASENFEEPSTGNYWVEVFFVNRSAAEHEESEAYIADEEDYEVVNEEINEGETVSEDND